MNLVEFLSLGGGVLCFIAHLMLKALKAENKGKLTVAQIIEGNVRLEPKGRGKKIVISLVTSFALYYFFSFLVLILLLSAEKVKAFHEKTLYFVVPFLTGFAALRLLEFITKKINIPVVKSGIKDLIILFQYTSEVTIKFWKICIEYATNYFAAQLIKDETNMKIIKMVYEKKKIVIALKQEKQSYLKQRNEGKITHALIENYGYNNLNYFIRNDQLVQDLRENFVSNDNHWNGVEYRGKGSNNNNNSTEKAENEFRRISDFKFIKSMASEGTEKLYYFQKQ
jgi:hypothetical protein